MNARTLPPALPLLLAALATAQAPHAQGDARALIAAAVQTELAADRNDHAAFEYLDHDITPDHDTLFHVVETPQGDLKRKLEDHGHPLSPADRTADDARIRALLADPAAQQRAHKDSAHDDDQAEQMLRLLPQAFLWTVASRAPAPGQPGQTLITLDFRPDPAYTATSLESRVLSAMAGQVVLAGTPNPHEPRIRAIRGTLTDDVKFGFGLFGRLRKGGTFAVDRREVAPGHWQMTASHTHIDGKALFFKTIGSIEDETRSDFHPSPAQTLQQALPLLANAPAH